MRVNFGILAVTGVAILAACGGDQVRISVADGAYAVATRAPTPTTSPVSPISTETPRSASTCNVPGVVGLPFQLGQESDEIGFLKSIVSKNWYLLWDIFNPPLDNNFDPAFKALIELIQSGEGLPETGIVDAYTYREAVWPMLDRLEPCS